MKRLNQTLPLLLAAALQILPLLRNIITSPAANSSFAIILRWTLGSTAALGAVDAVSGSTSVFTTTNRFYGSVGTYMSNNIICSIGGGNQAAKDDYFTLSNSATLLTNTATSTFSMPPGLTFKASWVNGASTIGGIIYGTPTTAGTYPTIVTVVSPGNAILSQNITNIITGSAPLMAPTITNQPAGITTRAGSTTNFTVLAGGSGQLSYQWYFNTNTPLPNATSTSLSLTNVRASQAGIYSVVVTNSAGAITSSPALLTVTSPPPPAIGSSAIAGGKFQFTFNPVVGLTNSVLANGAMSGGSWTALTNVPPPITTNAITVTDPMTGTNRFYRIQIIP
jgi:hypothetical protein